MEPTKRTLDDFFDNLDPPGDFTKKLMKLMKVAWKKLADEQIEKSECSVSWRPLSLRDEPSANCLGGVSLEDIKNTRWDTQRRIPKEDCPECKGTGKYTGFNKVEYCRTCITGDG